MRTAPAKSTVGLAHHWLVTYRGGEKVLGSLRSIFPHAPIGTLICNRGRIPDAIIGQSVFTSPLSYLPFSWRYYKALFPLHPWAFRRIRLPSSCRFVLSTDAAMVKGLELPSHTKQVCYCHTPPRYIWDMSEDYLRSNRFLRPFERTAFNVLAEHARQFDYAAAQRVDRFIANSNFVAGRIKKHYRRESTVIYPPVDVNAFTWNRESSDYYLLVSQLVPYKKVDIAIQAFNHLKKKLIVIGEGSGFRDLQRLAGPTVTLLGNQPFSVVKEHFESCKAFIHPQLEDFGITAVEAQAAGKAVIAYRGGGALESIVGGRTGVFFEEQSHEALADAVIAFEMGLSKQGRDLASACRQNAETFGVRRFESEVRSFLCNQYPCIEDEMSDLVS